MEEEGVKKLYILDDKQVYGAGVAKTIADAAEENGHRGRRHRRHRPEGAELPVAGVEDRRHRRRLRCLRRHRGQTTRSSCTRTSAPALPDATLWGPDGVALRRRSRTPRGGIPARTSRIGRCSSRRSTAKTTAPRARSSSTDFKRSTTRKVVQPYAIYGYEAMDVVLDAMERAGDNCNDRQVSSTSSTTTKDKEGVTRHVRHRRATAMSTSPSTAVYTIENGELVVRSR